MIEIGKTPTQIADTNDRCGEGPIWDWRSKQLFWDDIPENRIHTIDLNSGKVTTITLDAQPSGMALLSGGGLVFAGANGVKAIRGGKSALILADVGEPSPFNDILATPMGRIYAGSVYWGEKGMEKTGALYLIDAVSGAATKVDEGIEHTNGLALSPDGKTLYYSDTTPRIIYAYDVKPGAETLSRKRVFVKVPDTEGIPDGLTVDAEGYLWCAQWYGSQVVRYDPDGKVERRVALPVKQVSSVEFGGENLDILFITSAGEHWPSKYTPPGYSSTDGKIGGPLFAMRPGIQGRKEFEVKVSPKVTDQLKNGA